ncbi:integrase [Chroococcidiopsis sp. CCALA 051]|uniref:tyrosine-type recombinase/integrase n=1 Tax=Chroococcidiopsis sp. CCALA 051 TaxID=869949 RepID=UPI000D0D1C13|nr:tyrosine-type recombinase/integrase [Chroococcidiopsis sp. CCALA 051]MBE9015819.1 tyrosine-type recombinase/integrase [Chroococcidiopsidales cyanobacterium LEGE 13417]PSM49121.1 integrase [Chroococcidiopsis sp. CCALA 051]
MLKSTPVSLVLTAPLPLTEHPAAVYISSLAPGSRQTMRQALDAIASLLTNGECDCFTLDWSKLRYKHTAALRAALMEKYAPATANKMLCALRRVLKEALRLELIEPVDYARAVDIKSIKVTNSLRGRALTEEEIAALMEVCYGDLTPAGYRDAALMVILRGSGLRRREVVSLDLNDFTPSTGAILVRAGKGKKYRTVYLPESAIGVVSEWIYIRGKIPGPLLCQVNKAGRVVLKRLTPQAVLFLLQKRAKEASVASFSPHDFRRTFAGDLLDAGNDIVTVQKLMGHSSPDTTSRYCRRSEETKRRAVQTLKIPGTGRRKG